MKMKKNILVMVTTALVCSWSVQGQVLDLQTGRTADLSNEPQLSVEGGVVLGDYDYFGARGNLKVLDDLMLMASVGLVDLYDREAALGVDVMYQLPVNLPLPVALKAGFATVPQGDLELTEFSLIGITSGPINEEFSWYGNAGASWVDSEEDRPHKRGKDSDDEVIPTVGGGVVYAINPQATAFAGVDVILGDIYEDVVVGGGFRWGF